ncbi:MAG: endonuclease MutS2 [Nitrospiraceae bacterium]
MDQHSLLQQTLTVLEWPRILDVVAGQARSAMGAERCRTLALESDVTAADARLLETAEMAALREREDPFPSLAFPDLRDVSGRAAKGAVLEPHEFRDISIVCGLAQEVSRYLKRRREQAPALSLVSEPLEGWQGYDHLKEAIDRCVDPEGNIRESATPQLRRLMHQAQDLKNTMRRRLEMILASTRYAEVLQEQYFAQREGRYVVPVKAEMRSKIPGIVHDVSSSGATVFLEPRELVELNNSIKVAEREVEREVHHILQGLSAEVRNCAALFQTALEVLAQLDSIAAKASFSGLVKGHPVRLNRNGRIALKHARHPLLVLTRAEVVPNDIMMDETVRVLVISGPNTGGKTVTLKILGLFALMVRVGLQLPCEAGSEMALFPEVYADIGDAQDLAQDLSSFSAHITQMIALLKLTEALHQGEAGSRALVLLDEPVTSTDPAEGAALAEALLLRLSYLGMKVAVTTHYNSLKALAQTTPGFVNASVGFDVRRLAPTYRVIMGVPGGSSAIDIAGRLGMDETILDDALRLLRREDRTLELMLGDLQEKQRRLDEDAATTAELRAQAERSAREATDLAERLSLSERDERQRMKKKLTDQFLLARAEIQTILDNLKLERTLVKTKEAKQRLVHAEEQARQQIIPATESVPLDQLTAGDPVEIVSLGATGTLLEAPQGKKRVRVRVGDAEMSVGASLLVGQTRRGEQETVRPSRQSRRTISSSSSRISDIEAATVLDLRGKTADEAWEVTVAALDRAALAGSPLLRLIHGHGTGRLRSALRSYLSESPYVASFRSGERAEGGDGVTIVELK